MRLDSVSKSPMYTCFMETLTGTATIRAFGGATRGRFERANCGRVDHNLAASFVNYAANRWLACRLELIGNTLVLASSMLAVLRHGHGGVSAGVVGLSLSYALTFTDYLNWLVRQFTSAETNMVNVERLHAYQMLASEEGAEGEGAEGEGAGGGGGGAEQRRRRQQQYMSEATSRGLLGSDWPARGEIEFDDVTMRYRYDIAIRRLLVRPSVRPSVRPCVRACVRARACARVFVSHAGFDWASALAVDISKHHVILVASSLLLALFMVAALYFFCLLARNR
jgi:ABC-type multidrug transport system fused ATPase/permease subunit